MGRDSELSNDSHIPFQIAQTVVSSLSCTKTSEHHTATQHPYILRYISEINLKLLEAGDTLHIFGGPAGDMVREEKSEAKKVFFFFIYFPIKDSKHKMYWHTQK